MFWTLLVEGQGGGMGYQHGTFQSAKTEAMRIAGVVGNEGKKVYIMQNVAAVLKPQRFTWLDATGALSSEPEDIPF